MQDRARSQKRRNVGNRPEDLVLYTWSQPGAPRNAGTQFEQGLLSQQEIYLPT